MQQKQRIDQRLRKSIFEAAFWGDVNAQLSAASKQARRYRCIRKNRDGCEGRKRRQSISRLQRQAALPFLNKKMIYNDDNLNKKYSRAMESTKSEWMSMRHERADDAKQPSSKPMEMRGTTRGGNRDHLAWKKSTNKVCCDDKQQRKDKIPIAKEAPAATMTGDDDDNGDDDNNNAN
jgi:hypothetical protein